MRRNRREGERERESRDSKKNFSTHVAPLRVHVDDDELVFCGGEDVEEFLDAVDVDDVWHARIVLLPPGGLRWSVVVRGRGCGCRGSSAWGRDACGCEVRSR